MEDPFRLSLLRLVTPAEAPPIRGYTPTRDYKLEVQERLVMEEFFQRVKIHDDSHACKLVRALANEDKFCKKYQTGQMKYLSSRATCGGGWETWPLMVWKRARRTLIEAGPGRVCRRVITQGFEKFSSRTVFAIRHSNLYTGQNLIFPIYVNF
jgi:hypothetical protein